MLGKRVLGASVTRLFGCTAMNGGSNEGVDLLRSWGTILQLKILFYGGIMCFSLIYGQIQSDGLVFQYKIFCCFVFVTYGLVIWEMLEFFF